MSISQPLRPQPPKSGRAAARPEALALDVSRGQDVTAVLRTIEQAQGRTDIIVNNAGLNVRSDFRHMSDADWVKIREVNLDAVVRIARDGFELLRKSSHASLVNVASIWPNAACASSRPIRPPRAPSPLSRAASPSNTRASASA